MNTILKYAIYTVFISMITWLGFQISKLVTVFPDWRINTLVISLITFIIIIAIKRGVWH